MTNKQIAIIGLGPVAASIGLALRNAKQDLVVVGTDRDWGLASRMLKLGAVDRLERRPAGACKDSGLVILAEPLNDLPIIFEGIADAVVPGSVVTDIAPLKVEVLRLAQECLPGTVSFVGGHPLITAEPGDEPRADLFNGIEYCLAPAPNVAEQAVDVVSGLVAMLGAQPYFLDAAEHDGLMAAVEGLPRMLQLALLAALSEAGSWRDNQRAAGLSFINATAGLDDDAAHSAHACWLNRKNLGHWIDAFQEALSRLQDALLAEDDEDFAEQVAKLHDTRQQWLRDRRARAWEGSAGPVEVDKRNILSRLLLPEIRRPDKKAGPS